MSAGGEIELAVAVAEVPHLGMKVPVREFLDAVVDTASTTKTSPEGSIVMPVGRLKSPSPLPQVPHLVMNEPDEVNFWTRLFMMSATYTLPAASIVTSCG